MPDRAQLLKGIDEISFLFNDLTLYLDTHPTDEQALDCFKQTRETRKKLMNQFAEEYEPLTADCACPDTTNKSQSFTKYANQRHFTWIDGPLPWEGGAL